jgi:hypothetical protein
VNIVRTYLEYLDRKAAEDPDAVAIRAPAYSLPWLLLFGAIVPADAIFDLSQAQRVWIAVVTGLLAIVGTVTVTAIFVRECSAAARREPPRYSE